MTALTNTTKQWQPSGDGKPSPYIAGRYRGIGAPMPQLTPPLPSFIFILNTFDGEHQWRKP
jgi:hypothetical protein